MGICVLGISHKTATTEMLEKWLAQSEILRKDLDEAGEISKVILSTCNRWEIYLDEAHLPSVLSSLKECCSYFPRDHFYRYEDFDCFKHLCKVTSGIESRILSETEIQSQVKRSYLSYSQKHILPPSIHFLFQKALFIAKKARTFFPIPRGVPSLERVVFDLLKDYKDTKVLFVGNSQINRQIIAYLSHKGGFKPVLCTDHPSSEKADEKEYLLRIAKQDIGTWPSYAAVILAAQASMPLIHMKHLANSLLTTKLIIDLGMPRNSDLSLKKLDCLDIYDWDQICSSMENSRSGLTKQMIIVEEWLSQVIEEFYSHKKSRLIDPVTSHMSHECTSV